MNEYDMDELEIKNEFHNVSELCSACLSIGRKLLPIEEYLDIYKKLVKDHIYPNTDYVQLCWECHTQLRKAFLFQKQVIRASEIIQQGQSYIHETLSCLTTVIINNEHLDTIYFSEADLPHAINTSNDEKFKDSSSFNSLIPQYDIKSDEISINKHDDEGLFGDDFVNDDSKDEQINSKIDKSTENIIEEMIKIEKKINAKRKKNNKWLETRTLYNKKPKFKIVSRNELVIEKFFRRIKINAETLKDCIKRDRESNIFKNSRFKCDSCVCVFKSEAYLIKHNSLQHDKDLGPYTCDICQTRMPKSNLLKHIQTHYKRYECSVCNFVCCKKDLKKHLSKKHRRVFQCMKCDLQFGCRREFFTHFKAWHEKYICDHCGVSFKLRYCIEDHLRKQHSPFECNTCNKRFSRYNGLWLHKKLVHTTSLPSAYCVECDKHYRDVYKYRGHLANSARHKAKQKKKVPCPECDKSFSKRIYMTNHYEFVHLKRFRFRCEQCDKNFLRNSDLVNHNRKVHEGIAPPRNKICYVCGKGFHTNKILTNHLRTHTGERPFACARCPARFTQHAALRGHERALHGKHNT